MTNKALRSYRLTDATLRQLSWLASNGWNNATAVIATAVDRMYREERSKMHTDHEVFWTPSLPEHWIAKSVDEGWVMFPAIEGGWAKRTPYKGHLAALRPCDPATERLALQISGGAFSPMTMLDTPYIVPGVPVPPPDPALVKATARVDSTPELTSYRDLLIEYDWPDPYHYGWVATAPAAELVSWAEDIRHQEAEAEGEDTAE
jgi:hypothetical protein